MIRIGTRASPLALAQAASVADGLRALGVDVEIVPIRTEGDRLATARLAALGGKGLFVREIEDALLEGAIDLAVHSLKDLPAELPAGLELAAFPERQDPRDVLVTRVGGGIEDLPRGAVVGTGSPRRRAIVLAIRDDLVVEPIRGNVDTRLRKLAAGDLDAVVLAAAGLRRLGLTPTHAEPLSAEVFVPAIGQGILGLETRAEDRRTVGLARRLDHPATRACARAERECLRRLGASCNTPIAAHAVIAGQGEDATLHMTGLVASEDGRRVLRSRVDGEVEQPERVGARVADLLLEEGAATVTALDPARWRS